MVEAVVLQMLPGLLPIPPPKLQTDGVDGEAAEAELDRMFVPADGPVVAEMAIRALDCKLIIGEQDRGDGDFPFSEDRSIVILNDESIAEEIVAEEATALPG